VGFFLASLGAGGSPGRGALFCRAQFQHPLLQKLGISLGVTECQRSSCLSSDTFPLLGVLSQVIRASPTEDGICDAMPATIKTVVVRHRFQVPGEEALLLHRSPLGERSRSISSTDDINHLLAHQLPRPPWDSRGSIALTTFATDFQVAYNVFHKLFNVSHVPTVRLSCRAVSTCRLTVVQQPQPVVQCTISRDS